MTMKVSDLTPDQLDYWVAKAQGWVEGIVTNWYSEEDWTDTLVWKKTGKRPIPIKKYTPTTNWSQCGELIEKFKVMVGPARAGEYLALREDNRGFTIMKYDKDIKIAICCAVVASVYGEYVENE